MPFQNLSGTNDAFSGFLQGKDPDQDQQVDPEEREEEHGQRGEPHAHDPHDQDPEQH